MLFTLFYCSLTSTSPIFFKWVLISIKYYRFGVHNIPACVYLERDAFSIEYKYELYINIIHLFYINYYHPSISTDVNILFSEHHLASIQPLVHCTTPTRLNHSKICQKLISSKLPLERCFFLPSFSLLLHPYSLSIPLYSSLTSNKCIRFGTTSSQERPCATPPSLIASSCLLLLTSKSIAFPTCSVSLRSALVRQTSLHLLLPLSLSFSTTPRYCSSPLSRHSLLPIPLFLLSSTLFLPLIIIFISSQRFRTLSHRPRTYSR